MSNIAPGSQITLKIVKRPTSQAARKTLVRLLNKDAGAKAENARLEKARKLGLRSHQRGGREWFVQVVKQHPIKGGVGESGTITATLDVLTDLNSVSRFVEVTTA